MSRPTSPFLSQWNYMPITSETLTGSYTHRTVVLKALEDTVIKITVIYNNGIDPSTENLAYVRASLEARGTPVVEGMASNYNDIISFDEYVLPSNYELVLVGTAIPTYSVGFALVYKGTLKQMSDVQS